MDNRQLIMTYLEATTPGRTDLDKARSMLADDFTHTDPLVSAPSADAFVAAIRGYQDAGGNAPMPQTITASAVDKDTVAVLSELHVQPSVTVTYAHWYWVRGGKIARARIVYDPRPFLEMASGG